MTAHGWYVLPVHLAHRQRVPLLYPMAHKTHSCIVGALPLRPPWEGRGGPYGILDADCPFLLRTPSLDYKYFSNHARICRNRSWRNLA